MEQMSRKRASQLSDHGCPEGHELRRACASWWLGAGARCLSMRDVIWHCLKKDLASALADRWEQLTIKEVLLAPAPWWAMVMGKMGAAGVISLLSALGVVQVLVSVIGDWPASWAGLIGTIMLTSAVCVAAGTLLGNLFRHRQSVTLLTRGTSVPLFFLSSVFNPISYSTVALAVLARLTPIHYATALVQWAVLNVRTNTFSPFHNALVLVGFLAGFVCLSSLVLRRRMVTQ